MRQYRRKSLLSALILAAACAGPASGQVFPLGDTLTVIQRPLLNVPSLLTPGDTLEIIAVAPPETSGWQAALSHGAKWIPLAIAEATYEPGLQWWTLQTEIPELEIYELYNLNLWADGGLEDQTSNAVRVFEALREDWYFVHITDSHLPDHRYSSDGAVPADSTEMEDLREVIRDINLINPEFVLLTGDLVNEGELEDYLDWRVFSRAQYLLTELDVPVFLTGGNHDLGGWVSTPPPAGTARRDWWRFFGWAHLDDPPPEQPEYTQNYSFDYGPVHFTGLEAYDNYDSWRYAIYGETSFTNLQLQWLEADLAASGADAKVLFHHYDFAEQLNLTTLGLDMALWGHIHHNYGDIYTHPYDLATSATCDGRRAYRVIRVSGSTLTPMPTLEAGNDGNAMRLQFNPANDGTNDMVIALIASDHYQNFEQGLVKFRMPKLGGSVTLEGAGTMLQVDSSHPDWDEYYVNVDIQPYDWQTITLSVDSTGTPDDPVPGPRPELLPNYPNPFNPNTTLNFELSSPAQVRLSIHDSSGRQVCVLFEGSQTEGIHPVKWNGRDAEGNALASGLYVARLEAADETHTRKLVLLR